MSSNYIRTLEAEGETVLCEPHVLFSSHFLTKVSVNYPAFKSIIGMGVIHGCEEHIHVLLCLFFLPWLFV